MIKSFFEKTQNLPIYSWLVWNVFGLALIGYSALQGWVQMFLTQDNTHITKIIVAIFLIFQGIGFFRIRDFSNQLEDFRTGKVDPAGVKLSALMTRMAGKVRIFQDAAVALVTLGLIGTAVGYKIAISEVDPNAVSDPSALTGMITTMFAGMNYMLYTTIAGMVFGMWLMNTYYILRGAGTEIVALVQEKQP